MHKEGSSYYKETMKAFDQRPLKTKTYRSSYLFFNEIKPS